MLIFPHFLHKNRIGRLGAGLLIGAVLLASCAPQSGDSSADFSSNTPNGVQNGDGLSQNDAKNDPPGGTENDDEPTQTTDKPTDYFSLLPSVDYGGREFVIATTDAAFVDSETDSGIIGGALYARNRAIEEKFNIKLRTVQADEAVIQSGLQAATPDAPYADLLYIPMNATANLSGRGLLMNLYSVPFFDYDADYIFPEIDPLTVADTVYGIYGDAAYDERSTWCLFYNKQLTDSLGFDIDNLLRHGEWTWDNFLIIAQAAVSDLDQNRRMNTSVDRYGYGTSDTSVFADAVFASFGKRYFSRDTDGLYAMDYAVSPEDDYISVLKSLCADNDALYPSNGNGAYDAFCEGRLCFFAERLSYATTLAYAELDWGILPLPTRFPDGKSYARVDRTVCGYSVPQGVTDSDLCGRILTALYAYEASYPENVVEKAWTYYYLRSNASALAMQSVLKNRVYDIAFAYGDGFPDFAIASYELLEAVVENDANFSYLYAQNAAPFGAFMLKQFVH